MTPLAAAVAGHTLLAALRFAGTAALAVVGAVAVARWLGPEEFGVYRLALGLVWALEVLAVLALPAAANKFVAELAAPGAARWRRAVVAGCLRRAALGWAAGFAALAAGHRAVARFYRRPALGPALLLGGLSVLPGALAAVMAGALQGLGRFRRTSAVALVHGALTLALTLVALAAGVGVLGLLAVLLAGNLLQAALLGTALGAALPAEAEAPPAELRRRLTRFARVMGALAVLNAVVWERSEIFVLGRFAGPEAVAFYSLAYTLAVHARRLAPAALGEALFPVFARLDGLRDRGGLARATADATRYMAMLGAPLALAGPLVAAPLIALAFGAAYRPAAPVLAILLVAAGAASVAQPASAALVATERYRFFLLASGALAAANVALDLLLIPAWGAVGAALANTTVQVAGAGAVLGAAHRLLGVAVPGVALARCLAAAALALALPAALRAWPLGDGLDLAATGLLFAAAYPLALAGTGALAPDDFRRLRALAARLPRPVRPAVDAVVRRVEACCP